MKKLISIFLASLLSVFFIYFPVYADGDPNMGGGGGGVDDGDLGKGSYWNVGEDGVRVTIVKESTRSCVTKPLDFSNINTSNINAHFGQKCKLKYGSLQPETSVYVSKKPSSSLPQIVSSSGGSNIESVKQYFCSELNLRYLAVMTGFDYDKLINGDYVLLIEPILYFRYSGAKIAATATEAALYDQITNGDLKSKLGYATHQNLPLSMFLEIPQLGYPAYSGPTSGVLDDATIIDQLGLGVVNFKEPVPDEPQVSTYDYEYRTDTDVITSVRIYAGGEINPDDNASVVFNVLGKTYTKSYVIPAGESQLVWFKWHTPKQPQVVNIGVSASDGSAAKGTISCNVVKLEEKTPPNPTGRDRNDSFKKVNAPFYPTKKTATWGEWHGGYKVYMIAFNGWTPDGQLAAQDTFDFDIDGNVYDDWVIVPEEIE